jgi:transcriptional regulator with XRE-family HTH domain
LIDIEKLKAEIGKKLKAAREEKGMSQEHLATMLGLSKVGYGALERGKNLIGLQYLVMLTFILEKPITFFLPRHILTEAELNDLTHDPLLQEFIAAWPDLDLDQRRAFVHLAKKAPVLKAKRERGEE